jgi:hypothetical protein
MADRGVMSQWPGMLCNPEDGFSLVVRKQSGGAPPARDRLAIRERPFPVRLKARETVS